MKYTMLVLTLAWLLTACAPGAVAEPTQTATSLPPATFTPTSTATIEMRLLSGLDLDPADWQNWPVIPIVTERARMIYISGQELGNDPHAFSTFTDCLSLPKAFLGAYEYDPELAAGLPSDLKETLAWFAGSFYRSSPTVKSGTTTASLLWWAWHENKYGCLETETPVACELRIHKPSFVIIQVGTHYPERNKDYMRKILDQLIAAGVVPILGTKADNTETDMHINLEYAQLAAEYNIPLWNFWAAVQPLPKHGLHTTDEDPALYRGDLYLTELAKEVHRRTALESLDAVWRGVTAP